VSVIAFWDSKITLTLKFKGINKNVSIISIILTNLRKLTKYFMVKNALNFLNLYLRFETLMGAYMIYYTFSIYNKKITEKFDKLLMMILSSNSYNYAESQIAK